MPRDIRYRAEKTARQFHKDESFVRGLMGPIGSGKSVCCTEEIKRISFQVQEPDDTNTRRSRWAIIRNTYPELKSTTIRTFQDWFPENVCSFKLDVPITAKVKTQLPDGTKAEMEVLFLALDKPADVKKLLSLELTGVWINEAREVPKSIVDAATGRVGRYPSKRDGGPTWTGIIMDTNPPDDDHWWYRLAEEETPENWAFFQQPPGLIEKDGKYIDNPEAENINNLANGHGYYRNQVGGKTKEWIKVYIQGQYGTVQDGKPVYPEYKDELHYPGKPIRGNAAYPLILGWDFGLTPACVICQVTPRGRFVALAELVAERMGLQQFIDLVVKPYLAVRYKNYRIGLSVGDPAGNSSADTDERSCMDILNDRGIPTQAAPSNAPVQRLGAVREFLTQLIDGEPAFLLSPDCRVLRKGFNGGYKYERLQVSGDERYRDAPAKNRFSHPHDALQYACMGAKLSLEDYQANVAEANHVPYQPASVAGY
ncbi:hypothetical protein [Endozoicomonas sp. ALB091]|uniref:hypothetical protein n=1 Tax=Endozoicomonas sp. ALB091 TaxID=3403073 RepID=UPI003BB4B758